MTAVIISAITMVTGVVVATAYDSPAVAPFGWFLAAVGAVGVVANFYLVRRSQR